MANGLLLYTPEDYEKNKWFAGELITKASLYGLSLQLVLTTELLIGMDEEGLFYSVTSDATKHRTLDFLINRSRDSLISVHFEKLGCKVFNNSKVTEICNHKGRTHQLVNSTSIVSVPTLLGNRRYFNVSTQPLAYPVILKSVSGHGGSEVFFIKTQDELTRQLDQLETDDFVLQIPCSQPGIDIRVFTLGKEIIGAVRRCNPTSFKSNYSLGGSATSYTLSKKEEKLVKHILSLEDFDLIGIDFIVDQDNNLFFNEIEDVVGTRTLYLNYPEIDIVALYLDHISKCL